MMTCRSEIGASDHANGFIRIKYEMFAAHSSVRSCGSGRLRPLMVSKMSEGTLSRMSADFVLVTDLPTRRRRSDCVAATA
jgi:hypothetical protein